MQSKIEKALRAALIGDAKMDMSLYKYELEEHLKAIKKGIIYDKEDFAIAITHNRNKIAMLLITKKGELFINEKAKGKLKEMWINTYEHNINYFLPSILDVFNKGFFWINGIKLV